MMVRCLAGDRRRSGRAEPGTVSSVASSCARGQKIFCSIYEHLCVYRISAEDSTKSGGRWTNQLFKRSLHGRFVGGQERCAPSRRARAEAGQYSWSPANDCVSSAVCGSRRRAGVHASPPGRGPWPGGPTRRDLCVSNTVPCRGAAPSWRPRWPSPAAPAPWRKSRRRPRPRRRPRGGLSGHVRGQRLGDQGGAAAFCIGIGAGWNLRDPAKSVLEALRDDARVKPASACDAGRTANG